MCTVEGIASGSSSFLFFGSGLDEEQPLIVGIGDVELNFREGDLFGKLCEGVGGSRRGVYECINDASVYLFEEYFEFSSC